MEILPYDPAMAAGLASAYNRTIQGVPHCYPVDGDQFAAVLGSVVGQGESDPRLPSQAAFAASEGSVILGFIHVAVRRPEEQDEGEQGIIRFFWYERGRRQVGQALLEAAEDYFRERGLHRIEAFHFHHRYPFYYMEHAYLSDRLDHVHALMGFNGYERLTSEVFFDWPDFRPLEPPPVDLPIEISLHWHPGKGKRPGLVVRASQGDREVGICETVSAGEFSAHPEPQDWCFTEWLGVAEEMRGRGLGLHLLRCALRALHTAGYRHAAISTNGRNYRAWLFYSNCGYRVVDWTHVLWKELE